MDNKVDIKENYIYSQFWTIHNKKYDSHRRLHYLFT